MKKVLFLYAAPGSGHAQAAHAMCESLQDSPLQTVQDHVSAYFPSSGDGFVRFYKWLVSHHPAVWGHVHNNSFYAEILKKPEAWLYEKDFFHIEKILKRHKPDAVVATHALPLRALSLFKQRGKISIPLYGVMTDFRAHRYWASPGVDTFFASTQEACADLISYGIPQEQVQTTGVPIRRIFSHTLSHKKARQNLALNSHRPMVAVMGGSYGILPESLVPSIARTEEAKEIDWIFVFGSNKESFEKAKKAARFAPHIRLLGFTEDTASIIAGCDLLVTKAGGVTLSEALALRTPLLLTPSVSGQEKQNADYLIRHLAAVSCPSKGAILEMAIRFLQSPSLLKSMRLSAGRLARPDAARGVRDLLLSI